jgi:hypothetical protein
MGDNISKLILSTVFLVIFIFGFQMISAEWVDCFQYNSFNGGTKDTCNAVGCLWASDNNSEFILGDTDLYDPFCTDTENCCFPNECWQYDGTNSTYCESNSGNLNCTWDPYMTIWAPNGSVIANGGCMTDWASMGNDTWGGSQDGCWQHDGDKDTCTSSANAQTCSWSANDQNQNPWCWTKTLTDAQNKNPDATVSDIGCCEQKGCWSYDNNETTCVAAFQGNCFYENNSYGGGWCNTKWCGEIATEGNCTYAQQNLMMPCAWNLSGTGLCEEMGGGGFDFYNDDSDSCFSAGGWYNVTGDCVMPTGDFGGGSGGFMFAGDAKCWFADNQPFVCGNITGCAYCITGSGPNGVDNNTVTNICSRKQVGYCEGHDTFDQGTYDNANNSLSLACVDIGVKAACKYGPLPNCKWTNSSISVGSYCEVGNEQKSAPSVGGQNVMCCSDPIAKDNYTVCQMLIEEFMMPCEWQNETYPITNCTFNPDAVFGDEGEKDFNIINSQTACDNAGGSWNTEFYVDAGVLKQDSWCEATGMFNIDQGQGFGNKGLCGGDSCWAAEFQSNGTAWGDITVAEAACEASTAVGGAAGGCVWINDSNAFNGLGFCDFPSQMEDGGAKDCNLECAGCNFMGDPQAACEASVANNNSGCKWVSEGSDNYCVDKTKKTCGGDCFSCFTTDSCQNSSIDCSWDNSANLCSPNGFTGEICFDGIDNDADNLVDCDDPDCGFDNFCGGNIFGGDCFAQETEGTCNSTEAFDGLNCVWMNDTWNTNGWCDMPGANCWKFDSDLITCGATSGCTNDSSIMGDDAWCEMNWTKMETANCWEYGANETYCGVASGDCTWVNDTWCENNPADQWCIDNPNAGWCDYSPFASCMNLNSTGCSLNTNCTWQEDDYSMQGGWCDVACFDWDLDESGCGTAAGGSGLCEWRNMSETCQPSTFMMMGSSGGSGKTGCWQYDGNETGCDENSITCIYKNDTYANNNLSATEPSGWCMGLAENQHFGDVEGDVIDLAMDSDNIMGLPESGVSDEVDIMGMGMRVTDEGFNFGAGIVNISDAAMCNGYSVGNMMDPFASKVSGAGVSTTNFYWYLDTNGDNSDGCIAVPQSGANLTGYDFMIKYTSRNTSSGISETKQMMRCINDVWSPTNAQVTTSKKLSCGEIGGVMVALSSQDLEGFSEYDETTVMRIFMASANDTDSRTNPSDSVGPGYYTPGTIDFEFVDCSDPAMAKDSKCKNFQKFGFNVYEECKNGVDDDENGLVDCDDPFCAYMPECNDGTGFAFTANSSDITAPAVMFSDVEILYDAAFIKVDTNEPSNLTLDFYKNDSTCKGAVNTTLYDTGSGYQANANFKPFHSVDLMEDTLGYALIYNTSYYYKVTVCDPSSNCAVSSCLNFTTKTTAADKTFIFKVDLPDGYTVDIPALNKTGYNFTEEFGGAWYDVGIKTNTSVTKNMNMTIHCGDMSIGFFGMNVLSPTNIDLSNAFVCDTVNNLMGMNSSLKKWNTLISDLHLGGAADYIEITIPVAYSTSNTFNWTNDEGGSGQDVDDYVECRDGGNSNTICMIPVSMGFSAYTVTTPAVAAPTGDTGGNTGGGGGATANTTSNETVVADETDDDNSDNSDNEEEVVIGKRLTEATSEFYDSIKKFVSENKVPVVSAIVLLIILIVAFVGWNAYKKRY